MTSAWQGFQCRRCEGQMRVRTTGRANDGRVVVRIRECVECGLTGVTAEGWVPGTEGMTTVESFDPEQLFSRRLRRKPKRWSDNFCGHPKSPRTIGFGGIRVFGGKRLCRHKEVTQERKAA